MKKVSIVALVLAILMTVSLFGCSAPAESSAPAASDSAAPTADDSSAPAADGSAAPAESLDASKVSDAVKGKRLAVAHISIYDEWCKAVYDELMVQAPEMGFSEVNIQDGDINAETQQKQVEDFINQQYDMILIDPVSPDGIQPTLDKAEAAGIPVIAFDSGTDWKDLVSHIAWDHAQTGVLTGEYVADYAKENLGGKLRVGVLAMLDAPHTSIRSEKFKETIEKELGKENIEYVFDQDFGKTRESAANIVTNNIAKPVDIIWAAVGNAAFGAKSALETAGVTGPKIVVAGDWGAEPFNAINDGDPYYMMCVAVPPANIVETTLDTAKKYFEGDTDIPKEQNIELGIVDKNNISEYMKYVQ